MSDNDKVKTIIGRTDSWPCNLLTWSWMLSLFYIYNDVVFKNIGWLWGFVILLPICWMIYKLPVIYVIEPLPEDELEEFLGNTTRGSE